MRKVPFLSILLCAILLTACGAPAAAPEIGGAGAQEAATPTPAVGLGGPGEMLGFIVEDDGQIPGYMMMHGFLRTAENLGYPAKLYRAKQGQEALAAVETRSYAEATTMMLAGVVFAQMGMVMNNRTDYESVFKRGLFTNRYINAGLVIEVLILLAIIYIPFLNGIFNTAPISWVEWLYLLCIPFIVFGVEEIRKKILRKKRSKRSGI